MNADENAVTPRLPESPTEDDTAAIIETDDGDDDDLPANPFVGLRPFSSKEGLLFFGRDEQVTELMQKLARERFLAVVGSSGCGKSSLIRAGLIPKLKAGLLDTSRDRWRFVKMKPGRAPLENLAAALLATFREKVSVERVAALAESIRLTGAPAIIRLLSERPDARDTNVFLLIDQFEELFRYGLHAEEADAEEAPDQWKRRRDEAADFVSIMLKLAHQDTLPVHVVVTMRSDFLNECDEFSELPQAMNSGLYLVPRLTRQQRMQAVRCPINLYGEEISPGLLDRVLNDLGVGPEQAPKGKDKESDELPVMQHALMRTWENWLKEESRKGPEPRQEVEGARRKRGPLDLCHYEAAGTIKRALSDDAERGFASLEADEQRAAMLMFQALTDTDAKGRRLRRPAPLSELEEITGADRATLNKIIRVFRKDNRLFLTRSEEKLDGDRMVDISHESLIRRWTRLSRWVDEEAASREQYVKLATAAALRARGKASLLRDPELEAALKWRDERRPNPAWARRYHPDFAPAMLYLDESLKEREDEKARRDEERTLELQRARQLARQRTRTAMVMTAMVIALTLLLATAVVALQRAWKSESALAARTDEVASARDELKKERDQLEIQRDNAAASYKKEQALSSELESKREQLVRQTQVLEQQKRAEVAAKNQAVAARQEAVTARGTIQQQLDEIRIVSEKAVQAKEAGVLTWQAGDALRKPTVDVKKASCFFEGAIRGYKKLQEDLPVANLSADFGRMLFNADDDAFGGEAPATGPLCDATQTDANGVPIPAVGAPTPATVEPPPTKEDLPDSINKILGKDGARPAMLGDLKLETLKVRGLERYGEAIKRFRNLGQHYSSAPLLNEIGDSLQPSRNDGRPRSPRAKDAGARAQAAILLFCEAYDDLDKTGKTTESMGQQLSLLLKVGHRLNANLVKEPAGTGLAACPTIGSKPADYFDKAATYYEALIRDAGGKPEAAEEKRDALAEMFFQVGEDFLNGKDANNARKYFDKSAGVYGERGLSLAQREKKATQLQKIGNVYYSLGEKDSVDVKEVAAVAEMYFQQAADVYKDVTDAEGRKALSNLLIELGLNIRRNDDGGISKAAKDYFERAANVHLSVEPKDYENAAQALTIIGNRLYRGEEDAEYYLRAVEAYQLAGNKKEAEDLLFDKIVDRVSYMTSEGLTPREQEHFRKAEALYTQLGTREQQADALSSMASDYLTLNRLSSAMGIYVKVTHLVEEKDHARRGRLMFGLGKLWQLTGVSGQARAAYLNARKMFEMAGDGYKDERGEVDEALESLTIASGAPRVPVDIKAELAGAPIGGAKPGGEAEFKSTPEGERQLIVRVNNIPFTENMLFDVLIDGSKAGVLRFIKTKQRGKLILDTEVGQTVPMVRPGMKLVVKRPGRQETLVEGEFSTP
ncbi:MAG TPA: hypothetical protein VFZ44_18350 [Pyrinomonadaceae bacterium]